MEEEDIKELIEALRNLKGDEMYMASVALPMKIMVDVMNEMYTTMDEADPMHRDHMTVLKAASEVLVDSAHTITAVIDGYFEENPDPDLN